MLRSLSLLFVLMLAGCRLPQWRVFEANVPAPLVKEEKQVEAERSAADLVARTITEPRQMIAVAQKLSESLGAPEKQIDATDLNQARDKALVLLLKGIQRQQEQLDQLNAKLEKYEGKKIEGTGVNVFGFAVSLPVIGLIALCVLFPSVAGVLFWLLRKFKGALTATIKGIQDYKNDNPGASAAIVEKLDRAQDRSHKLLVRKIKSKLVPTI